MVQFRLIEQVSLFLEDYEGWCIDDSRQKAVSDMSCCSAVGMITDDDDDDGDGDGDDDDDDDDVDGDGDDDDDDGDGDGDGDDDDDDDDEIAGMCLLGPPSVLLRRHIGTGQS